MKKKQYLCYNRMESKEIKKNHDLQQQLKSDKDQQNFEEKIKLYFCHGSILIWDQAVIALVRSKYRIVGGNVGCLTSKPRQNSQFGLPLQLSNIEATFLLEYCNAILLNSSALPTSLNGVTEAKNEETQRQKQFEIQTALKQDMKLDEIKRMAGVIKKGKITKQKKHPITVSVIELNNSQEITKAESEIKTNDFNDSDFQNFAKTELKKVERYGHEQTWIKMEYQSKFCGQMKQLITTVNLNSKEQHLYTIFCDLHRQGFFITDGVKFGGDFLVYPGDPGLYHSTHIVLYIPYEKDILMTEYATFGRLASSVKKTLLLASVNKENKVVYSSMTWSGIV